MRAVSFPWRYGRRADRWDTFLTALIDAGFRGQVRTDYGIRAVMATDNSLYEKRPRAVVAPLDTADVQQLFRLASQPRFAGIYFCPRGGGTAPNGQALTEGICVDLTRYMHRILDFDAQTGRLWVQAGATLDQVNQFLAQRGYYFPVRISPSNRATIGGMVNTNACGAGSARLGRMDAHVTGLSLVYANGSTARVQDGDKGHDCHYDAALQACLRQHKTAIRGESCAVGRGKGMSHLSAALSHCISPGTALQEKQGGQASRAGEQSVFLRLRAIMCGSEGTLATLCACQLQAKPLPGCTVLLIMGYKTLSDALAETRYHQPGCAPCMAELLDDNLITLSRSVCELKSGMHTVFARQPALQSANVWVLASFTGKTRAAVTERMACFLSYPDAASITSLTLDEPDLQAWAWQLRKSAVELMSRKTEKGRRPLPFIEDTAVPLPVLKDYFIALTQLLSGAGLVYGIYGHLDAGCLHVRPALDIYHPDDRRRLAVLSDQVYRLVCQYGGVMWAEHGLGARAHYINDFFSPAYIQALVSVKRCYDPQGKLNPDKLTGRPAGQTLLSHLRPLLSSSIEKTARLRHQYPGVLECNGNARCFDLAPHALMCPSYKATRDRVHSPKGRAALIKRWVLDKNNPAIQRATWEALSGCLGCKACVSTCPVKVNIPRMKSVFLSEYYQPWWRFRHIAHYVIGYSEYLLAGYARFPSGLKWFFSLPGYQRVMAACLGWERLPPFPPHQLGADRQHMHAPYVSNRAAMIYLLPDVFTAFLHPNVLLSSKKLIEKLGYTVSVLPFYPSGYPLHTVGLSTAFHRIAKQQYARLTAWVSQQSRSVPPVIISIEPTITLAYQHEYRQCLGSRYVCHVNTLSQWLSQRCEAGEMPMLASSPPPTHTREYQLFLHCTEWAVAMETGEQWQHIFRHFGLPLSLIKTGCCGMAGIYGYEKKHAPYARQLYQTQWAPHIQTEGERAGHILATGYSCREQINQHMHMVAQCQSEPTARAARHPVEALYEWVCQ